MKDLVGGRDQVRGDLKAREVKGVNGASKIDTVASK